MKNKQSNNRQYGFTLLEMLMVIGIVGVLAAVALGRYESHIATSNRHDARAALILAQQSMQRGYLESGSYDKATLPAVAADAPYSLSVKSVATNQYVLEAKLKSDSQCSTLTISENGTRGATPVTNTESCWQ